MRAALVLTALCLSVVVGIPLSPAQETASDVAYVEAVKGFVTAYPQGAPIPLDVLDIIRDRTRLELPANSELGLCHYRIRKLVTLKGPLHASISASGVTAESGKAISPSAESCIAPVISIFQGGIVSRSIVLTTAKVPLRPSIKIANDGTKEIRKITLWDAVQGKVLATFAGNVARPILDNGRSYLLVVERSDGSELKMIIEASTGTQTGPLILVAR
jgi:hypothetical protein